MKNNLFDKHVKEQLVGLRPEVPAYIWENIVAVQGRKKPAIWGWFTGLNMAAAALLLLTASLLTYYFVHNANTVSSTSIIADTQQSPSTNKTTNDNNSTAIPDQSASNTGTENQSNNTSTNTSAVNNNVADQNNSNNLRSAVQNNAAKLSIKSKAGIASEQAGSNTKQQHSSQRLTDPGNVSLNIINVNADKNDIPFVENQKSNGTDKFLSAGFFSAGLLQQNNQFNPRLKMPVFAKLAAVPCPKAEREAAGNKTYVEVYGGPDLVIRSISDYNNGAYEQQRRESSHTILSYSAGVRYTKVFGSGMSIRTGLNYSQISENFSQVKGHVTQNVYITNDRGDTTGTYTMTGTRYKKNTNKFKSIDIPVMAGYEFGNGRLHTNINAGAMINLRSSQSGFVVDPNGNTVDVKQSSVYRYKNNTGVSLAGAVSVYYKLNEKLHILAEPYFRYSLSPITQDELTLKQKYHTAGLRVGFRLDL